MRKLLREVEAELERLGVIEYRIEKGKKHPKLRFMVGDSERLYVLPGTASDHRALKNAIGDIRRMISGTA